MGEAVTKQQALEPCPFCGGKPEIVTRDVEPQGDPWYGSKEETFVLCGCGACLFDGLFHEGFYDADTRAVEAWSQRPLPDPDRALMEQALRALQSFPGFVERANPAHRERFNELLVAAIAGLSARLQEGQAK